MPTASQSKAQSYLTLDVSYTSFQAEIKIGLFFSPSPPFSLEFPSPFPPFHQFTLPTRLVQRVHSSHCHVWKTTSPNSASPRNRTCSQTSREKLQQAATHQQYFTSSGRKSPSENQQPPPRLGLQCLLLGPLYSLLPLSSTDVDTSPLPTFLFPTHLLFHLNAYIHT